MFPSLQTLEKFNNSQCFAEGWYWLLEARRLKPGQVKPVTLLGRNLAVYRTTNGQAIALDAYCPHMGAHLAEGRVEGESLRCFFHNWTFNSQGDCIEIPCLGKSLPVGVKSWPTQEAYGLIWLWIGSEPRSPLPVPPELEGKSVDAWLSKTFVKDCHPNVVMINAIDAHHFNTVHNFPITIDFKSEVLSSRCISFQNQTKGGKKSWFVNLITPFYRERGTYDLCYWNGSTGTVTLGPDFLHFYIMFSLRMLEDGKTEGATVLMTKQRSGILGWLLNPLIFLLTALVGNYFAKGDTQIFRSIRFNLKTPIAADRSILEFIQHFEQQPARHWASWEPLKTLPLDTSPASTPCGLNTSTMLPDSPTVPHSQQAPHPANQTVMPQQQ